MRLRKAVFGMSVTVIGALILISSGVPSQASGPDNPAPLSLKSVPLQLAPKLRMPLAFEEVESPAGQTKFLGRGPGYDLLLTPKEACFIYPETGLTKPSLVSADKTEKIPVRVVSIQWLGAEASARIVAQEKMQGYRNYYVGNQPEEWRTKVPLHQRVLYQGVYPGIDLVFYEQDGRVEYDFVVAPGANPKKIRLAFQGVDRLSLDRKGNLVLHTPEKKIVQLTPVIYQEIEGIKKQIRGHYVLKGKNQLAISLGAYDPSRKLVIDPHIEFCTYLGGGDVYHYPPSPFSPDDRAQAVALDPDGNVYVTGYEFSVDYWGSGSAEGYFPVTHSLLAPNQYNPYPSAFATKFSPTGELIWSLIISGKQGDFGNGIAVDSAGNAYVTGETSSGNFPIMNGYQDSLCPPFRIGVVVTNAFLIKVDSDARLLYSTYLGGGWHDEGSAIAVDNSGKAYVTGFTRSHDFPTQNALFSADPEGPYPPPGTPIEHYYEDAFVAVFDTTQTGSDSLVFSTYLGGVGGDYGTGIAVDSTGNIYVSGFTESSDFPLVNEYSARAVFCPAAAFLSKLNPAGTEILYSTLIGPVPRYERVAVAADDAGNAYLTGQVIHRDFPVRNAYKNEISGCGDAFVTRMNTNLAGLDSLIYSTYLGGISWDGGIAIAADNPARVYVVGTTTSPDFPLVNTLPLRDFGLVDIFVACLNTEETGDASLTYSTYLGGTDEDYASGVAINASSVTVCGYTLSPDLPVTPGVFQQEHANTDSYDAFILRISEAPETALLTPTGPGIFYYPPRNFSVVGKRASTCLPLGWGNTTKGALSLQVGLPKFETPMNLYLALFDGKDVNPNNLPDLLQLEGLFFIGPKGEIQPTGQNPIPWKSLSTEHIDQLLSVDVSQVNLAGGQCYLALIALPSQVIDLKQSGNLSYCAWLTSFPVVQKQQQEVLQSLNTLNLIKKNPESWQIMQAIQRLEASLTPAFWKDVWTPSNSGKRIFDENQKAVQALLKSGSKRTIVTEAINTLVKADRTLATNAMVGAVAKAGAPQHLLQARKNMERAQKEIKAENLVQAITFYGKAWDEAEKAAKMATSPKQSSIQ